MAASRANRASILPTRHEGIVNLSAKSQDPVRLGRRDPGGLTFRRNRALAKSHARTRPRPSTRRGTFERPEPSHEPRRAGYPVHSCAGFEAGWSSEGFRDSGVRHCHVWPIPTRLACECVRERVILGVRHPQFEVEVLHPGILWVHETAGLGYGIRRKAVGNFALGQEHRYV